MAIKWDQIYSEVAGSYPGCTAGHAFRKPADPEVLPIHLLAALLEDKEGVVLPVLEKIGVAVQPLQAAIADAMAKLPKVQGSAQQPNA